MLSFSEIVTRIKFWNKADRIGPDMLLTHWRLHFKSTMRNLCVEKFNVFGDGSEFRPGAYAEACSKISIGKNVVIRPGTFLFADPTDGGGGITIEDKVLIGPCVHFYTNNHEFSDDRRAIYDQGYPEPTQADSILLKSGCWIGAGSIILPGVTVGINSVVGAGSVVTKDVPDFSVALGSPARVVRMIKKVDKNESNTK
jgi:acetyltransferase-like isoleucine patch superfamily enzyme